MGYIERLERFVFFSSPSLRLKSLLGFINEADVAGNSVLYKAVYRRDYELVEKLLLLPKIDVNINNRYGVTPLHEAILKEDLRLTKMLLCHPNIDIHVKSIDGMTPFLWACRYGVEEIIQLFLDRSELSFDARNAFGYNCFDILTYKHPLLLSLVMSKYEEKELNMDIKSIGVKTTKSKRL